MYDKLLKDLSIEQAITRCGELLIEKAKIPLLLSDRLNREEQTALARSLSSPDSAEYMLYAQGAAEGGLKLAITLDANASNPKVRDGYKNLNEERRRQAINKKLYENFGIGEEF